MTGNGRFYLLEDGGIMDREYEFSLLGEDELVDIINGIDEENGQLKQRIQLLSILLDNADTIIDLSNNGMAKAFWKKRKNEVEQEYKMKYKKGVLE